MSAVENTPEDPREETDSDILAELLERTAYMVSAWADIRTQGDLNMKALSMTGPLPQAYIDERSKPENMRPCDHVDIISPNNDRVVNQWRMNPRGVKVDQAGEGATDETAELRESRIREIAYSSQAKSARLCGLQNAVDRGYGCWEVYAEYESPRSSKQKPCIGRIPNPNSVLVDPDTTKADRSDMQYALKMGKTISAEAFKRKYKNAKDISSFPADVIGMASKFISGDGKNVTPAEYFRIKFKEKRLLTIQVQQQDGSVKTEDVFEDELAKGLKVDGEFVIGGQQAMPIKSSRMSEVPEVQHFVTNGLEILSRDILPISTIPIIFVVAREKYENDKLTIEAMTAKQRAPQLHFDLARNSQIENINQTSKSKWVISDKAILGYEAIWKNAHRDPTAYLPWHAIDPATGQPNPAPERTDFEPAVSALELFANACIRDVMNTSGVASADTVDRVAKSGVAQKEIKESTDVATFHITDNVIMGVEYEGRILNEWLDKIEDSERTVGLRKADGKYRNFRLVPTQDAQGKVQHPYGEARDHAVTIGTGPDWASQKDEQRDVLTKLVENPEAIANPLLPQLIHELELGPGGDKMEKIALSVQPQAVQAAYADGDDGQEPLPPQALMQIEQKNKELEAMNAHAKALETKVIELEQDIQSQAVKSASDEKISADDNLTTLQKTQADNSAKLEIERMKLEHAERMKLLDIEIKKLDLERERLRGSIQAEMQARTHSHESVENEAARKAAERKEAAEIG